jgi:hypothetical protein
MGMNPIQEYIYRTLEGALNPEQQYFAVDTPWRGPYPLTSLVECRFDIGSCRAFGAFWSYYITDDEYLMCLAMLYTLAEDQGV